MHEDETLARLPDAYRRALQLRRQGANQLAIAAELDIEPEAVGPLLRIADAKLAALRDAPGVQAGREGLSRWT
jgi:DNA-directed RNA polymerase specialized sigma24 family protein